MDPTNNPTPTSNPDLNAAPTGPEPVSEPNPSIAPAEGVNGAADAEMSSFDNPATPNPTPVNPVINPGTNPAPVNPVFQPGGGQSGLSATDPIMRPEAPTPPDPIEEELKAPMKAAEPVPGSIGSAVSGPDGANTPADMPADNPFVAPAPGQTPSVSFSDPVAEQTAAGVAQNPAKKKNSKNTLIALIIVASMIVIALVAVLIISLTSDGSNNNQTSSAVNSATTIDDNDGSDGTDTDSASTADGTLSCTRNMTEAEMAKNSEASSGVVDINADFVGGQMTKISLVESVTYTDEDGTDSEPEEMESSEATADELTPASALNFFLNTGSDGNLDLSIDSVRENYEDLDFTCEVL